MPHLLNGSNNVPPCDKGYGMAIFSHLRVNLGPNKTCCNKYAKLPVPDSGNQTSDFTDPDAIIGRVAFCLKCKLERYWVLARPDSEGTYSVPPAVPGWPGHLNVVHVRVGRYPHLSGQMLEFRRLRGEVTVNILDNPTIFS